MGLDLSRASSKFPLGGLYAPGRVASSDSSDWKPRLRFRESGYAVKRVWMALMSSVFEAGAMVNGWELWIELFILTHACLWFPNVVMGAAVCRCVCEY